MPPFIPKEDLELIIQNSETTLSLLKNKTIFISGATGFLGKWLFQSLVEANKAMSLNIKLHLLSRDWIRFKNNHPHFNEDSSCHYHQGDIRSFQFPQACDFIIHAANESHPESVDDFNETVAKGTQRILKFASFSQATKVLILSSGAVYGDLSNNTKNVSENDLTAPISFYGKAKLKQESLALDWSQQSNIGISIARCFSTIGPHLPLDKKYAAGNFIQDTLNKRTIQINGDGSPLRSFLYTADLVVWLLKILVCAPSRSIYNVGSDQSVSIEELAHLVAKSSQQELNINIKEKRTPHTPVIRYVPSIHKAQQELQLSVLTPLAEAIKKTIHWNEKRLG